MSHHVAGALSAVPFGATCPAGWLAEWMRRDLAGFVGHLDELVPDLVVEDDIYGRDRRTDPSGTTDVGAIPDEDQQHPEQFLWWNSESQSNWRDGWLRHILLVGDDDQRTAVRHYVDRMLATADDDGYLGIHAPELRYPAKGENGELWAQATLGRALLGYVDATDDRAHAQIVLDAVARAMRVTMAALPPGGPNPFPDHSYAGAAHGLMVVDVLDRLTDLTGDPSFRAHAAWLYRAFGEGHPSEPDAQLARLLDPNQVFVGHGVHTYEGLRALVIAHEVAPTAETAAALGAYLRRIRDCLTPAHGPIGDEWILGRSADATTTGYELCSTQELLDSLVRLVISTGDLAWADEAEQVALNAGLGAWHPHHSAVAYLQTDNAFAMCGNRPDLAADPRQQRYRYSPVHRETAVCCVPNAARLLPTYLRGAVLRLGCDIVVAFYGPMATTVHVDGTPVTIEQRTSYPNELSLELAVDCGEPTDFGLVLRVPTWASGVRVDVTGDDGRAEPAITVTRGQGRIVVRGHWHRHLVRVEFIAQPRIDVDPRGDGYVSHGPRVFALPIPERTTITTDHGVAGLAELAVEATSDEHTRLALVDDAPSLRVTDEGIEASFRVLDAPAGVIRRTLTPLGTAALRRLTFPLAKS